MMSKFIHCILPLTMAMVVSSGCVMPGAVDPSVVNRYQQAMAEQGVPQRGTEDLQPFRPVGRKSAPPLKVLTDEKTGARRIELSLQEAVLRTLANSTEIQVVSFDPAVSREDVIQAAAEFDYIVFAEFSYEREDQLPTFIAGTSLSKVYTFQAGIREKTVTGAIWSLAWTMARTWDDSVGPVFRSRYEPVIEFEIAQPLLRDGWSKFNLARLKVARLNHKISMASFRQKVEETINDVISVYWTLVRARGDRDIQRRLLEITEETLIRVKAREGIDATDVQIKQTEAAVESRRASFIRAQKTVLDVQELLARLLADSQINVLSEYELIPTTPMAADLVRIDITDQLLTALRHSPLLAQTRLAIAVADINVDVAANQMLPRLDLKASGSLQGLQQTAGSAHDKLFNGDQFSYFLGMAFEYPIGNRERVAQLRKSRYERLKAIATHQNIADQVASQVKERIREIGTNFQEMKAQRSAVNAARIQLQALEHAEEIREQLTPEFLQVKLQAQDNLAVAARSELEAIARYNTAMAELARATGTVLELHRVKISLPVVMDEADWPEGN